MSTTEQPLRVLSIMVQQADFEFNLGATFALLRQTLDERVQLGILPPQTAPPATI